MMNLIHIIQILHHRRGLAKQNPSRVIGRNLAMLFSVFFAIAGLLLGFEYANLTKDLPSIEILPALLEPPGGLYLQPTRLYDRTGEKVIYSLQNPGAGERVYLPLAEMASSPEVLPSNLISATVAAIDPNYWSHPGFDLKSEISQNSRTIAQRLVDDLLLAEELPGFRREIRNRILSVQITRQFGRQKLMEWYLNHTNFSNLAFGAPAAAQLYFGKHAQELSFAEAAILLAQARNPSRRFFDDLDYADNQKNQIVKEALRLRLIDPKTAIDSFRSKPQMQIHSDPALGLPGLSAEVSPAFIRLVFNQLAGELSQERLSRGGLRILTTLDYDLQAQVRCASSIHQLRIQDPATSGQIGIPVDCHAARLLPALKLNEQSQKTNITLEVVVLDPHSGQILALNGEAGIASSAYNALNKHPTGSLSTLFISLAGFTRGLSPASLVWDIPSQSGPEASTRFSGEYQGPIRLRMALANDYLAPFQTMISQVGVENIRWITEQMGISPPRAESEKPDSVLDVLGPMSLVEISQSTGVFAAQGLLTGRVLKPSPTSAIPQKSDLPSLQPTAILRVEDNSGRLLIDWSTPQSRSVLSPQLAYLITDVLSDETARWPSLGHPNPLEIGRPSAAKIGSTLGGENSWVIGYTPQRVVGVWLGQGQQSFSERLSTLEARNAAAGLWHAIMHYANRNLPYQTFPEPAGLSRVSVCDPSGMLLTAACPNVVDEVFLNGNEPVQHDTLNKIVAINRATGKLATVFTPPDLVDQRIFISIPPEARKWTEETGIQTPPEEYDTLPAQTSIWQDTRIDEPQMFASVRGKIVIRGKAEGKDLSFYRIQYGQGVNPVEWYQLGEDKEKPVSNGVLATWDTSNLAGLYAVQLLVVREDQSAERSTVLVNIDNQPPKVTIHAPTTGELIQQAVRPRIVLQAEVEDDLLIKHVVFKINGQLIADLMQPPFAISWRVKPGRHSLVVVAEDSAGNICQSQVDFTVE